MLEATRYATEEGLALAVFLGGVAASWALLASVPWIYCHHLHPPQSRLVFQQRTEAGVRPEIVEVPFLLTPLGGATSEPGQVFNRQGVPRLKAIHNPLCQGVQGVVDETSLPSSKPFPKSFHAFGAFGRAVQLALDFSPLLYIVQTLVFNWSTRKLHPAREGSHVALPHVQANYSAPTTRRLWSFYLQEKVDVPLPLRSLDQHTALDALGLHQHFPLVVAKLHGDYQATYGSSERNRLIPQGKGALVKCAGGGSIVFRSTALLASYPRNRLDCQVSRKSHRTEILIDQAVQLESAKLSLFLGYTKCVVAAFGKQLYCFFQSCCLFRGGLQGTAKGKRLHEKYYIISCEKRSGVPPLPEDRGIHAARFL